MCTVTIIQTSGGFRLATNRDEQRARPTALAPSVRSFGERRALAPTDPQAGGTWVAATDAGLAFTVLNGNPRPMPELPPSDRLVSRGMIIPTIAGASTISEAVSLTENLPLERMAPFRLVACDGRTIVEAWWACEELSLQRRPIAPSCWVSSGLGDQFVQTRLPLFTEVVLDAGATPESQDAYHTHQWPDNPRASVFMDREDARTVSRTIVDVCARRHATMRYIGDSGEVMTRLPLVDAANEALIEQAARRTP
jgi:hypothetical protein